MTEENNISTRLKSFIEKTGLSSSQFADKCGIPRPSISQIITGRNRSVNNHTVALIHKAFPNLNIEWFIIGEGEMIIGNDNHTLNCDKDNADKKCDSPRNNSAENLIFKEDRSNNKINSKENGVKTEDNVVLSRINSNKNAPSSVVNNGHNPEKSAVLNACSGNQCRKIVQITIYYDDSTFENLYPGDTPLNK